MPRATALDHQKTRNYIPSISNEFNQIIIQHTMACLEKHYFHKGRVVSPKFENMSQIRAKFRTINFDCLLDINEQIVPRFVLEFYCQLTFNYNSNGQFVVNFVIQNKPFSLTLEEFGEILKIPFKGHASTIEMWSLDHLSRRPRANRGKKRPRETNDGSSSTTQNQPFSSVQIDDIVDDNDNKSSHFDSSSSTQHVSSSSNVVHDVYPNLPHENHDLNNLFSETITL
ncbi:hypothetical protein Tco_0944572 [Tanacetum coccineum]